MYLREADDVFLTLSFPDDEIFSNSSLKIVVSSSICVCLLGSALVSECGADGYTV